MCVTCGTETNCKCNITTCVNPITHMLSILAKLNVGNSGGLLGLPTLLQEGFLLRNDGAYCCPDCNTKNGFYYIGPLHPFITITDALNMSGVDKNTKYPCCVNTHLKSDHIGIFNDTFKQDKFPCCVSTGFEDAIVEISGLMEENQSLVEASTFAGKSGLSIINFFLKNSKLNEGQKIALMTEILDDGLVVKCVGCEVYIYNATSFVLSLPMLNLP